jgi:hypothetical protein
MRCRSVPIALGMLLVATLTAGPAWGAGSSDPPPDGPSSPHPKLTCGEPTTSVADAPAVGSSTSYDAPSAGSATVAHPDAGTLHVNSTSARAGWTAAIFTPNGPKVRVTFYENAKRGSQVRMMVALDSSGRRVHIRIVTCG